LFLYVPTREFDSLTKDRWPYYQSVIKRSDAQRFYNYANI